MTVTSAHEPPTYENVAIIKVNNTDNSNSNVNVNVNNSINSINSINNNPHRDYSKLRKAAASQSLSKLKDALFRGEWTAKEIDDNDAFNTGNGATQKQRQHASKSALHMAAWKGCLENVRYLIEDVGCDVDAFSTQEFSYGKTAIFFALTQSRPEVTEYLLEKGARVTIVNNKGQSVLSMAATHFETEDGFEEGVGDRIVAKIRQLEDEQAPSREHWWNFRATHSDGFEYGDLDPRFFVERPLTDADITSVTPLAINPTHKHTRKGGFLRRNPGAAIRPFNNVGHCKRESHNHPKKQTIKPRRPKPPSNTLSPREQQALDRAWDALLAQPLAVSPSPPEGEGTVEVEGTRRYSLLEILRWNDQQRSSWIPQTVLRLREGLGTEASIRIIESAMADTDTTVAHSHSSSNSNPTTRQIQLLEKLLGRFRAVDDPNNDDVPPPRQQHTISTDASDSGVGNTNSNNNINSELPPSESGFRFDFEDSDLWKQARASVEGLRMSCLEEETVPSVVVVVVESSPVVLALPNSNADSIRFVDSPSALRDLLVELSTARLVAIDTEWHTPKTTTTTTMKTPAGDLPNENTNENASAKGKPTAALSTLQIAVWNPDHFTRTSRCPSAYVVDLMHGCTECKESSEYRTLARTLVKTLLEAGQKSKSTSQDSNSNSNAELPLVLGFAIRHDLPMLEGFLLETTEATENTGIHDNGSCGDGRTSHDSTHIQSLTPTPSCYPRVLDLQTVFATDEERQQRAKTNNRKSNAKSKSKSKANLPGLKACVARYASLSLSKTCQCSDWGQRPLSKAQLEYAGLDAAILLVLLAERSREVR